MRKRRLPSGAIRLKFLTQTASVPQEFVCFVRGKKMIPKNYMSHFENELKRIFHLEGIPIRLVFREAEPKDHD
jgi:predicted GTPase